MTTEAKIRKFKEFHYNNPLVYHWFKYFMLELLSKKKRVSATLAYERARWEVYIEIEAPDEYRLDNIYRPAYIRVFLKEHPHYKDLVETRTSIFDEMYPI